MPAAGLECRSEKTESGVMSIEGAFIVKEYALNVPRKVTIEGLEFALDAETATPYLILSTGNFGGSINVLELS